MNHIRRSEVSWRQLGGALSRVVFGNIVPAVPLELLLCLLLEVPLEEPGLRDTMQKILSSCVVNLIK